MKCENQYFQENHILTDKFLADVDYKLLNNLFKEWIHNIQSSIKLGKMSLEILHLRKHNKKYKTSFFSMFLFRNYRTGGLIPRCLILVSL